MFSPEIFPFSISLLGTLSVVLLSWEWDRVPRKPTWTAVYSYNQQSHHKIFFKPPLPGSVPSSRLLLSFLDTRTSQYLCQREKGMSALMRERLSASLSSVPGLVLGTAEKKGDQYLPLPTRNSQTEAETDPPNEQGLQYRMARAEQ